MLWWQISWPCNLIVHDNHDAKICVVYVHYVVNQISITFNLQCKLNILKSTELLGKEYLISKSSVI